MRIKGIRAAVFEARRLAEELEGDNAATSGTVLVSGMLCEQLARQLGAGAERGAVVVDGQSRVSGAAVFLHVIAGEPSPGDHALVRAADKHGVPVVLVQLWPQDSWTAPFVLTPFVVECEAGRGFPIEEIAGRIAEAVADPPALARRIPVLQDEVARRLVGASVLRSALVGVAGSFLGASRPVLALEQVRLASRLRASKGEAPVEGGQVAAGVAAAALVLSFALRGAARKARRSLPAPLVNAALATGTTWALGEALRRFELLRR
jgi:hypothetical protein